jgi:type II secretory pathway pseudopilin PulG
MTPARAARIAGATLGDMLIFLSVLSLAAALLYPAWSARSFRRRVERAVADVDAVSAAARAVRESTGQWPSTSVPGEPPPELTSLEARDSVFSRQDYRLAWGRWEIVDSVPAPPETGPAPADAPPDAVAPRMRPVVRSIGGVSLYSSDSTLLAELTARYAESAPVVLDTVLLIVLPERAAAPRSR